MWIAVGENGHVWTSPDAKSWSQRVAPGSADLRGIATDDATIVAVGTGGAVYVSEDAVMWRDTTQNVAVGTAFWSVSSDVIGAGLR